MTSGVVLADMLEGMRFALGPSMSIRRDALEAIGGMEILADYCADDYVIGNEVFKAGYKVVLSDHVIDHVVLGRSLRSSWEHQVRWMKSTRFSRPKGHLGSGLTFATPFGILALIAGLVSGDVALGVGVFAAAILNRVILALIGGWGVVHDGESLKYCWLYPVRDLLGFALWCASFGSNEIVWRDRVYRLQPGGFMAQSGIPAADQDVSAAVTVDDLA
jgi:ceramide glucosyltransferase